MIQEIPIDGQTPIDATAEAIERLIETETVEEAWAVHCQTMRAFGFERLFYGYTRFRTQSGVGHHDDFLILSSMPDAYMERFINEEMYRHAPMTTWARENVGAMSWSWIARNRETLDDKQLAVLDFNRSFGITVGYTIAFRDVVQRHKGAIALTARDGVSQQELDALWREKGREINVLNQVAHLKFTGLPLPRTRPRLSDRQREVLEWVGDGKTSQDIAVILGLTTATVDKHLKKARETLLVETTAQAVRKASVQNQIFVVET